MPNSNIGKPVLIRTKQEHEMLKKILSSKPTPAVSKSPSPKFPSRPRTTGRYWQIV